MTKLDCDFLIVGGGIAGLWLLAELKAKGYNALLCESNGLGAGQTLASQGIIHGGTKYALTGKVSKATMSIGDMPKRWKQALAGQGAVDLSAAKVLSQNQLLWTSPNLASKMTGFFASKVMQSRMQEVKGKQRPAPFDHTGFKGKLYQLDEPVLDIPSVMRCFQSQFADSILQIDAENSSLVKSEQSYSFSALLDGKETIINAQKIVLCAGEGNETLSQALNSDAVKMQRRPLKMIMAKGTTLPAIYAHALGVSDKPKVTITSHFAADQECVWYIGGEPAENGVGMDSSDLIKQTKELLQGLLPWMDFLSVQWSTFEINRAEGLQKEGKRPDQPVIQQVENVYACWPTKLALAPMLSDMILEKCADVQAVHPVLSRSKIRDRGIRLGDTPWNKV